MMTTQARDAGGSQWAGGRASRATGRIPITLTVASAREAVRDPGFTFFYGGIFIATRHPPEVGTLVDVVLEAPDRRLLFAALGKIVRVAPNRPRPGVGVQFVDVSYESQELIDALVAHAVVASED